MSEMPLYLGDEGEQAQGLSQMQDQAGYQEGKEDLKQYWDYNHHHPLRKQSYRLHRLHSPPPIRDKSHLRGSSTEAFCFKAFSIWHNFSPKRIKIGWARP
jgi:hypothetical protein